MDKNKNIVYIETREKIYLDTSAAMHYVGFKKFVDQIKCTLIDSGKKIIVLKVVWLELIRNYNSSEKRKANSANQAISIISRHRDIFEIEDEEVFQYEMEHAFADKVLLSSLILERTNASILLITNDRMLSKDAMDINHQSSCRGREICTCFIADDGNLLPGYNETVEENIEPKVIIKEVVREVDIPVEKEESWIFKVLIPIGTLFAGVAIGKYSDQIIKIVKSVA